MLKVEFSKSIAMAGKNGSRKPARPGVCVMFDLGRKTHFIWLTVTGGFFHNAV